MSPSLQVLASWLSVLARQPYSNRQRDSNHGNTPDRVLTFTVTRLWRTLDPVLKIVPRDIVDAGLSF